MCNKRPAATQTVEPSRGLGGRRSAWCLLVGGLDCVCVVLTYSILGALAVCATTPHAAGAEMSGRAKSKSVDV